MRLLFAGVGVLFLIIFGIIIFGRGGGNGTVAQKIQLSSYVNNINSEVQYTLAGPINALENHRILRVTISPQTRTFDMLSGYQGSVISTKTYPNDNSSYQQFMAALDRANFTKVRSGVSKDYTSVCPTGNRSVYDLVNGSKTVFQSWSGSCTTGNYGGNISLTATLFQVQIPDYQQLSNDANLTAAQAPTIL